MHVLEIRTLQTRGKLEVSDKPCRSQFETGLACVEWRFWSGAQTSQGGAVKLRGDWGGSSVAAHSRAIFSALLLSSVPDKTAIRLHWLKLVGRVGPLRVSQNCHFVPFVSSVVGNPFYYKFCLESVPLNHNHYGFPRNRTKTCRKHRQNRSLKT